MLPDALTLSREGKQSKGIENLFVLHLLCPQVGFESLGLNPMISACVSMLYLDQRKFHVFYRTEMMAELFLSHVSIGENSTKNIT